MEDSWERFYPKTPLNVEPIIDDTTLRDGVQMPGIALSPENTAHLAYLLDQLGVERMELHQYQQQDREAVKLIQDKGLKARIAVWCRAVKEDVEKAVDLDVGEIGISHPVSYIHIKSKWPNLSVEEIFRRVVEVVEYAAKDHGLTVFVHGEDSTRADWRFESRFINAVSDAGAEVYRICDTVGVGVSDPSAPLPTGIPEKIRRIKKETRIKWVEIHAHDDLGNAVENTMAAIRASSNVFDKVYASTTFLGVGERAGNAETEKVMLNLYLHHGVEKYGRNLRMLKGIADFIGHAAGLTIPPNKAIVGDYAFAHESGIHTYGALSNPLTYEPYPPEMVGNTRVFTIGKQSGKAIIKHKMKQIIGEEIRDDDPRLELVVQAVKAIFEKGRRGSLKEGEFKEIVQNVWANQILQSKRTPVKLDELDYNILRKMQQDGRISLSELSERLKTPLEKVRYRLEILRERGVIMDVVPLLDPIKLGFNVSSLIMIKGRGKDLAEMEREIAKMRCVNMVYDITGEYDAAIVARFTSQDELNRFLKKLLAMKDVERTATSIILHIVKEDPRLPI
jgi:isopropylmalate/homocitrate/citramalate synthase/DNA-binding Lrp family transcriptional regulator